MYVRLADCNALSLDLEPVMEGAVAMDQTEAEAEPAPFAFPLLLSVDCVLFHVLGVPYILKSSNNDAGGVCAYRRGSSVGWVGTIIWRRPSFIYIHFWLFEGGI